jgi:hypothetical protein
MRVRVFDGLFPHGFAGSNVDRGILVRNPGTSVAPAALWRKGSVVAPVPIVPERLGASRLPSLRSARCGLDPPGALPSYCQLPSRRRRTAFGQGAMSRSRKAVVILRNLLRRAFVRATSVGGDLSSARVENSVMKSSSLEPG